MKSNRVGKSVFFLASGLLAVLVLGGSQCTPTIEAILGPKETIMIAFNERGSPLIHALNSNDGLQWSNTGFPTSHICLSAVCPGVGVAGDRNANFFLEMHPIGTEVRYVWGLLATAWDDFAEGPPSFTMASAPSVTSIIDKRWAVAYRRTNNTVTVSVLDTDLEVFIIPEVAPGGGLNSNVIGRPAIVRRDEQVLLAWRRGSGELVTSVGQIQSGSIMFAAPQIVPLPTGGGLRAGLTSDPDVARDNGNFYIAMVREETGGSAGGLHGWRSVVMSSSDGMLWNTHSVTFILGVVNVSKIQIAGLADGTLVIAAVDNRATNRGSVARFDPATSTWSSVDRNAVFAGRTPSANHFALVGVGKPD